VSYDVHDDEVVAPMTSSGSIPLLSEDAGLLMVPASVGYIVNNVDAAV